MLHHSIHWVSYIGQASGLIRHLCDLAKPCVFIKQSPLQCYVCVAQNNACLYTKDTDSICRVPWTQFTQRVLESTCVGLGTVLLIAQVFFNECYAKPIFVIWSDTKLGTACVLL